MAAAMLLAGCSFASNTTEYSGSVTPIPPAIAESNPLRTLNPRPAAPVLNTGNFPATSIASGSTTPPGANPIDRRPLVTIRFYRLEVPYEEPLDKAVHLALERRPDAIFDVVAVAPQQDDPSQLTSHSKASKRNAEKVFRSLTGMGIPPERVSLSATTSANVQTDEVQLYVR
jgi:hypothetical protein